MTQQQKIVTISCGISGVRAWYGIQKKRIFPYFILAFFLHSMLKIFRCIFHTILKFSIFLSILPYQGKFKAEATRNLYYTFATLSEPLQVVAREGRQYGMMNLIFYLKHYRNKLP